MPPVFGIGLKVCWFAIAAYWLWAYRHNKVPEQTEPLAKRLAAYWLPFVVALLLLGPGEWFGHSLLRQQFVPHTTLVYSIGLGLCVSGAALAIWSRYLLGRNWSATVQLKHKHELIISGPYSLVRHPLYTGLLVLFVGNAIMVGDWRGLPAIAIIFTSLWFKLRLEERWLVKRFGNAYSVYQQRTKMLLPALL